MELHDDPGCNWGFPGRDSIWAMGRSSPLTGTSCRSRTEGAERESPTEPDTGEQETISFEHDIQPLFRERDRNSMSSTFDPWSYGDVASWSDAILTRLRNGSMPCDGEWPKEQVALFEEWVAAGKRA
jgi:hypothetical protein